LILKSLFLFVCFALTGAAATPVILISVDTLRADHVGRQTPHIDSLAKNGTVFSQASSPFPLTLPAHVALFTSTFPFANGVQDNGIPLKPTATTLATVLKKAGYRTGAFVGSYVLDRRFGLSHGFDVYDGPLDLHNKVTAAPVEHKRPGDQVEEAAKSWVESKSNTPFFLFLHLYDLHAPYSLPADPSQRHGETGYRAELAYVDQILGDFFSFLDKQGILQKALIVFTSDHGEGLGEHSESSHGYFVYETTLHVPLIIHWPAGSKRIAKDQVDDIVSLLDVAPTILEAIGVSRPAEMRGRSLMIGGGEDVYSESVYARKHFGCASLRSLRSGNYHYIDAPKPELYDLASDANEQRNLYEAQKLKASALRERLLAVRGNAPVPAARSASPETVAALRSLGYLSGSSAASRMEPKVDPKDRIGDFEKYTQALGMASVGQVAESDEVLTKLREKLPDVVDIKMSLGSNLRRQGNDTQAIAEFKRALALDPANALAHFDMGMSYFRLRQSAEATKQFKAALAIEPWYTRADEALAQIYIQEKNFSEARAHLNHILTVDPDSYTAHFNLGVFAAMEQHWDEAQKQISAAVRADPRSAEAHNSLGMIFQNQGKSADAEKEFRIAQELGK
jgi:arylsulfatase A-like enzyme/Tfp pilus assembly protein PilF